MNELNRMSTSSLFMPIDGLDIQKIFMNLLQNIRFILLVSFSFSFFAFLYTFTILPEYESSIMLRTNSKNSNSSGFLARFGYGGATEDSSGLNTLEALIRTRYMLEPIIEKNSLNISAAPRYFPYVGQWIARHRDPANYSKPFLWLKSYGWGGEKIAVSKFSLPARYENQTFRLVSGDNNTYQLYSPQGELILTGEVGKDYINSSFGIIINISSLSARPGIDFFIRRSKPLSLVNNLAHKIQINNIYGNDISQGTGIIQISFRDADPDRTISVLNAIIKQIIANDTEEKTRGNKKNLALLDKKLSKLNSYLKGLENELNQYHITNNTLSMSADGQYLIKQIKTLEQSIDDLRTNREELLLEYTPRHPLVITNISKEAELQKKLNRLREQLKEFPVTSQKEITLTREINITNSVYVGLLAKRIAVEDVDNNQNNSNIVILSDALPAALVGSNKLFLIIMGFLAGAFLSSIFVILKNAFRRTIEDANQIEKEFNLDVISVLPYSRKQKILEQTHQNSLSTFGSGLTAPLVLAKQEPDDLAVESFRSLRISLDINHSSDGKKIIAIMGSLSNVGKSFVSINLAQVIADSGKKTLLIDTDLRRGRLHNVFFKSKNKGLSEYLEGITDYKDLIHSIGENLSFISCGNYKNHPLKLFQNSLYHNFIAKIKNDFDQIIIDTPPILPVSDTLLIARHCNVNLLVACPGKDEVQAVRNAIKKAHSHDVKVDGVILNHKKGVTRSIKHGRYAYGY